MGMFNTDEVNRLTQTLRSYLSNTQCGIHGDFSCCDHQYEQDLWYLLHVSQHWQIESRPQLTGGGQFFCPPCHLFFLLQLLSINQSSHSISPQQGTCLAILLVIYILCMQYHSALEKKTLSNHLCFSSQSIKNFAHSSFQYALQKEYPLYMRQMKLFLLLISIHVDQCLPRSI